MTAGVLVSSVPLLTAAVTAPSADLLVAASRPWAVIWVLVVAAGLLTGLGILLVRRS